MVLPLFQSSDISQLKTIDIEVDEQHHIWIFRAEGEKEKSEKHVTRISAEMLGNPITFKALDKETLDTYEATQL